MKPEYVPTGSSKAKLAGLADQLELLREQDPVRYEAFAEGMHVALASIREACEQLDQVLAKVQQP